MHRFAASILRPCVASISASSPLAYSTIGVQGLVRLGGSSGTINFSTTTGTDLFVEQPDKSRAKISTTRINFNDPINNDGDFSFDFSDDFNDLLLDTYLTLGLVDQFLPLHASLFTRLFTSVLYQPFLLHHRGVEPGIVNTGNTEFDRDQYRNRERHVSGGLDVDKVNHSGLSRRTCSRQ